MASSTNDAGLRLLGLTMFEIDVTKVVLLSIFSCFSGLFPFWNIYSVFKHICHIILYELQTIYLWFYISANNTIYISKSQKSNEIPILPLLFTQTFRQIHGFFRRRSTPECNVPNRRPNAWAMPRTPFLVVSVPVFDDQKRPFLMWNWSWLFWQILWVSWPFKMTWSKTFN